MTLVRYFLQPCKRMVKTQQEDGEGGYTTSYVEGDDLQAAIVLSSSVDGRIAEQQTPEREFTVTTSRSDLLEYHEVIKRVADGELFRATGASASMVSPSISPIDIAQTTAERFTL